MVDGSMGRDCIENRISTLIGKAFQKREYTINTSNRFSSFSSNGRPSVLFINWKIPWKNEHMCFLT